MHLTSGRKKIGRALSFSGANEADARIAWAEQKRDARDDG